MTEEAAQVEAQSTEPAGTENALVESPTTGEQATETPEKRPSRARDRIQALASDKRAAVEYAEFQKRRADELEAKLSANATPALERPDITKYDDAGKWAADFEAWTLTQAESIADQRIDDRLKKLDTERTEAQIQSDFEGSLNAAAEKYDDFWEVIADHTATHMNGALLDTLRQMPDAGDLAYYLNTHPAEARQIAAKSPVQIAADLGRLSMNLNTPAKKPTEPNLTKAPEPPSDISGTSAGEVDLSKVSIDEYMAVRRKQLKERRGY